MNKLSRQVHKKLSSDSLSRIERMLKTRIDGYKHVAYGAASNVYRIYTSQKSYIVKRTIKVLPCICEFEAKALRIIEATNTASVPDVIAVDSEHLILEDLGDIKKNPKKSDWYVFGQKIGLMHRNTNEYFGLEHDNYCGIWEQKNPISDDPKRFYYENRISCYFDAGLNNGMLTSEDRKGIESFFNKIYDIVPKEPPALCHGDLHRKNVYATKSGIIYLLDPALYYGCRESDIAITKMYQPFPGDFYHGYEDIYPLQEGWEERLAIFQLKEILLMIAQFGHLPSLWLLRKIIKKYK